MKKPTNKQIDEGLITYAHHRLDYGTGTCRCGATFPATLVGLADHKRHRMEEVLKAAGERK